MSREFRHAVCNEMYQNAPFAEVCRSVRKIGYAGIEIAPFTLAEKPAHISPGARREYRDMMESEGLEFAGLHWLMVSPPGLHVTTPDQSLRERSWRHIADLIDLCGDLGDSGVMVFGSPKQRCRVDGLSRKEATENYIDGLSGVAQHAQERDVTILVEALPLNQCDVINSLAEAVSVVHRINHPAVRTMFDTHNAVDETEPHAALVDRYFELIRHVHVNEMDGRYPGTGGYDFKPVLDVLRRRRYAGWISLEVFDFTPGAETIAGESLRFLEREIGQLAA